MKNKDRSHGGQQSQSGQSTGNQQNTSQTSGTNNGGQDPRNNKFEGQGEGRQEKHTRRDDDGGLGNRGPNSMG